MSAFLIRLLLGCAVLLCSVALAEDYPYEAYVVTDDAEVVAGPGHRFYITERLARGTQVEIYREEPSGWLAIRPPEGSFSWVPADFVERLDDELGKVKEPAAAWIGTSVEHVSEHHQQFTLKAGELVSILSEKTVTAKSGGEQTWLKISPPAGEFRWIHLRDVSRQKPKVPTAPLAAVSNDEPVDTVQQPTESPAEPQRIELVGEPIALSSLDDLPARVDRRVKPAQFRQSTSDEPKSLSPDGFVPRKRRDQERSALPPASSPSGAGVARPTSPARVASVAPRSLPTPSVSSGVTGNIADSDVRRQLDQIELDLSLMLSQQRSQWDFTDLERRVQALVDSGADPVARGRARLVLDKIKQFEKSFAATSGASRGASTHSTAADSEGASSTLADPRYDAQGTLKEVISRKSVNPVAPYAVVDGEGQPLCFISPSPGLNLNRYLNKQVGLYGRRGYLEELKKPHVLAERVIELQRR